ncbi:2-dehydropantoate 2-reductase [Corynebacterium terpenotabidum]|uniref:2-dehydropantoate 2-reductase n=1 Tax=Corynebacterium terpenotabidum Y-11 TaxID=1200352 RepID=S4XC76_9CORY|nr:2-dehydropantoate 2-reductase [Corynebacterium terpenotabidum]AGP30722.1 2-dehydropantoate 2-reductase [Corynebacterium terpenotabidum Y-11]
MRIGIIGAGAVGTFFGARLARAGHEVTVLARGETLDRLRSAGLTVTWEGDEAPAPVTVPVHAVAAPADITAADGTPVDIVLLAVKATGETVDDRRRKIAALISGIPGDPVIVTTQNSVEAHRLVADAVGEDRTWPGVVRGYFIHTGPATVRFVPPLASLTFGRWEGVGSIADPRLVDFAETLTGVGIDGIVRDDVWCDIWEKAMFVTCFGALGAAADQPIGVLRTTLRSSLEGLISEAAATARAAGVPLAADAEARTLAFSDSQPAGATSSMQRDIAAGIAGELDSQLGAIMRVGDAAGVETPLLDLIDGLLRLHLDRN